MGSKNSPSKPKSHEINVLLVDDHAIVREGLRALIQSEPGMQVIGEAVNGIEALELERGLAPDVILLDLIMPQQDGLDTIKIIKEHNPNAKILVLTGFSEDDKVFAAIKSGALGYLLKDTAPQEVLQAIRDVHQGQSSLHPVIARKLIQELKQPPKVTPSNESLTAREVEVLQSVARGMTNQDIAKSLFVSERTVRNHVSSILAKLHLANRTQAALYALREGFAELEK